MNKQPNFDSTKDQQTIFGIFSEDDSTMIVLGAKFRRFLVGAAITVIGIIFQKAFF